MNFAFFLVLASLGLRLVSSEKCSEALHEEFKKGFDRTEKCGDCVIRNPRISLGVENWAGFCDGNQLYLFRDWKCKGKNDLLNLTELFAVVTNKSCELIRGNHDLNEKCLIVLNNVICDRQSDMDNRHGRENTDFNEISTKAEIRDDSHNISFRKRSKRKRATSTTEQMMMTTTKHVEETFAGGNMTESNSRIFTTNPTKVRIFSSGQETECSETPGSSSNVPFAIERRNCEQNEYFFNGHCYFINNYRLDLNYTLASPTPFYSINAAAVCQERHPKALGLAVETEDENTYIMNLLKILAVYTSTIFTSGVGIEGYPHEWSGWNLKINHSILQLAPDWDTTENVYYCINACKSEWYLLKRNKTEKIDSKKGDRSFCVICERLYNPKNVQPDLHEKCLQMYRESSCYHSEKHVNYCCEKDETGELWFGCPLMNRIKKFPRGLSCEWMCGKDGYFAQDRPICSGTYNCDYSYNGIRYIAPTTKYAQSRCPALYWGFSTWFCSWNRTFLGTPDYSLCCDNRTVNKKPCRETDSFLNAWMGCPSKKTTKKTACPPGSALDEAMVEWYCQENGTFYGSAPDYSNCTVSKTVKCIQTDRFGRDWEAEAGTTIKKICPPGFSGHCLWHCKSCGKFDGPEPDCSICKAEWMNEVTDKIKNHTNHEEVMKIMETFTEKEDITIGYGHVLNLTADCVVLFKQQVSESELSVFEKFLKSYSKILKNVAGNPNTWSNFSVSNRRDYSEKILQTTQTAAFANLEIGNSTTQKYNETFAKSQGDGFDFFVAYNPSVGSQFPLENFSESDWHVHIKAINESNTKFAAMGLVMSDSLSSLMFPQGAQTEDLVINAPAITFTVATSRDGKVVTDPNVVVSISFKHKNRTRMPETVVIRRRLHVGEQPSGVFNSTLCFYYRGSDWTTEGCSVTFTSKDRTNCTCNHLSTIGLLMSIHKYQPNWTLEIVSAVSSGITILSLIMALLVFYFFDTVGNERLLIGKNLCFCLLIGHAMLITVLDKKFFNIPDKICMVSAILLHYVFMAAFAWMFVEGCHLYRMLVLVFDSDIEYRFIYLLIGYGMPFVVVGVTQLLGFILQEQPYGQDEVCWLKSPIYVWAFVGPVIILTSINFCILIIAMKLAITSKRKTERSNFETVMLWLKGWVSLSALLGVTWLFGLAYFNYSEPLVYVFVFFNGLQGFFIFLFRCVLCEQYRTAFWKIINSRFSKSKSKSRKKSENVKSETKLYAISGTKSLTDSKDSGFDPGIDYGQKYVNETEKSSDPVTGKTGGKPKRNSSEIEADVTLAPATSEAYLRNRMIARNFSVRKSKAKLLAESENFPELSYHYICHPK